MRRMRFGTWVQPYKHPQRQLRRVLQFGLVPCGITHQMEADPSMWSWIHPSWGRDGGHRRGVGDCWDQTEPRGRSQGKGAGKALSPWHGCARSRQCLAWSRNSRRVPAGRAQGVLLTSHSGGQGWVCCSMATLPPRSSRREPDSPNSDLVQPHRTS